MSSGSRLNGSRIVKRLASHRSPQTSAREPPYQTSGSPNPTTRYAILAAYGRQEIGKEARNTRLARRAHIPHSRLVRKKFTALAGDISGIKEDIAGVKGEIADLRTAMLDEFEHVDTQFSTVNDQLRDMTSEIVVIHRRIERLEEQGANNAGFAKEIDLLMARIAEIEKHLGLDKKIAA